MVAIVVFVAYDRYVKDDGPNDGWKTYRSERFKFEIRYPATWELERESGGDLKPGMPTHWISFMDPTVPTPDISQPRSASSPPLIFPPRVVAWVNPQGDWCTSSTKVEKHSVTINGVQGEEHFCYLTGHDAEVCQPKPICADEPWSIMLDITRSETKFWVFVESFPIKDSKEPAMLRNVIGSFRFVD